MKDCVYNVRQIDDSCWEIDDNGAKAFLVTGSERAMLVDTGFGSGDLKGLVTGMTELPVFLVNTHADRDHIGCNHQFEKACMHPAEFDRYRHAPNMGCAAAPLWEGEGIDLGGRRFEAVLIPGHTPGSIALLDRENRVLLSGDTVQDGSIYMFGPGRNLPAYIASLEKLLAMKDRFDRIYPSHGSLPVLPDQIDRLLEGALRLQRGELTGRQPGRPVPALEYDIGTATFLYEETEV